MATHASASAPAVLLLALTSAPVTFADSTLVMGADPDLQAGANALRARSFDDGVRLTEQGLDSSVSIANRAAGLSNLCAGYTGLGRYEEAIAACNESLRLRPRNWRSFNNRALAYLFKGEVIKARRDVERGLAINPESETLQKVDLMIRKKEAEREVIAAADRTVDLY